MTLLILYEELAAYFVKCISVFAEQYQADVHIIRKGVNKEAPFRLEFGNLKIYNKHDYNTAQLQQLAIDLKPDVVFSGGWADKDYLQVVSAFKGKVPTIVGFDNKWIGSLKQWLASIAAPFYITRKFSRCFVPGPEQKQFALKMGFRQQQIAEGAYCCDFDLFHSQYLANRELKKQRFPHRFIYVGRYVEHKGVNDLWQAFAELQEKTPNDWELWCLGTGDVQPFQHPQIKHFGFVQPQELTTFIRDTGVFILPSHFEPWGVVVHEYAAAGFPVICSDQVGARTAFVENNFNGYIYQSGNTSALKAALKKMMNSTDNSLFQMGENSVKKAKENTPEIWSKQLKSLI